MKEEFENDLSAEQKEELKAQEKYAELKAALTKAIDAGAAKLDEMEEAIGIFSKRHVWIRTDDADDQQQGEEDY